VSRAIRWTNVVPTWSTSAFVTSVATISRRSGWPRTASGKRSTTGGGKVAEQVRREERIVGQRRREERALERELRVRHEHASSGRVSPGTSPRRARSASPSGIDSSDAIEAGRALEVGEEAAKVLEPATTPYLVEREEPALRAVVREDARRHVLGQLDEEAHRARRARAAGPSTGARRQILRFTS
jgi:hypothetical protein